MTEKNFNDNFKAYNIHCNIIFDNVNSIPTKLKVFTLIQVHNFIR